MKLLLSILLASAVATVYASTPGEGWDAPQNGEKWITREHGGQDARDKILDQILANYKTYSYPENSTVKFGISLLNFDLDQEKNAMHSDVWFRIAWSDNRLVWDEKETGVKLIRIPADKIWLPDITLYNSAFQKERASCWKSNVLIYSTGMVLWVPPCTIVSSCNLTLDHEPFGEQVCTLKFGSWTFDGFTQGLDFWQDIKKVDTSDFLGSPKYELTKNVAERHEKKYDCCVEPYIDLTFTLGLTRVKNTITCPKV